MLDKSYSTKLSGENVLEIVTQNKQKLSRMVTSLTVTFNSFINKKWHMFPDEHGSDKVDFDLEMDNLQINNNIDCNGIPQQIALVQVNGNDFRTTVQ